MAIMGFGGGAMIGAPLSVMLMDYFKTADSMGVMETFLVMGCLYFISMTIGALSIRLPPENWQPKNFKFTPVSKKMITTQHVHIDQALKTPQFYLLWLVLCLNVTAGIGVLGQASVMIQEVFKGSVTPAAAAGFVGLLSLFNMGGRFIWSTASDYLGRKNTYFVFFVLGAILYALVPIMGHVGSVALFVLLYALIMSMYGGGFATIPAYLADIFGTRYVGGIHGRLLTAWATAGVLGPVLVNYLREFQIEHGVAQADSYNVTMYIMAGILVLGFFCNLCIKPVHARHHIMKHDDFDDFDGVYPVVDKGADQ
jgi:MFS family permease